MIGYSFHAITKTHFLNMTVDFNTALLEINAVVMKRFGQARFYEAQGQLTENVDGTVSKEGFRVIYGLPDNATVIGSYDKEGKVVVRKISDIWCEDIVTTPYIPLCCSQAIDILKEKFGEINACPVTLRHALYPGEIEPKYFIGTHLGYHTVGVYSAQVDATYVTKDSCILTAQRLS